MRRKLRLFPEYMTFFRMPRINWRQRATPDGPNGKLSEATERRKHGGGRGQMFTGVQEAAIVNLVLENNEIRLREIQSHIIQDNTIFSNIQRVSLSTLARILKRNQIRMKQLYKVPLERNSQRNKEVRRAYVDGVLEMDAHAIPHEFIFIDDAGFNLAKTRRRGRNVIGHRAIIDVPGQRGGNITMCAAISNTHGVLHRHVLGNNQNELVT
ncbi:uncharacterized protein LOC127915112 [Oncorhynchus keta]|uniref:uncharacterized protein LOC127915112 n=1 Tax=Oncorhynchus keta TaxID=8018 RepID=UPI00227B9931|nr:uncharacterized protein LOC127915112 [Oncorhynchus keta]